MSDKVSSVSPTSAAKMVGVARSTIYNDMAVGKLSYNQEGKKRLIEVPMVPKTERRAGLQGSYFGRIHEKDRIFVLS